MIATGRKLFYIPLEPLRGRYTEQLARPITGWNERNWLEAEIPYTRIDGPNPKEESDLGHGKVINTARRCEWAFSQTTQIVNMILNGTIESDDVVYFDDFWHPGLEMIKQAIHDSKYGGPDLFSFCHAQSVDQYDFMHERRHWASHIEHGFANIYNGVFVNNDLLAELLSCRYDHIDVFNCGHPFSEEEVIATLPHHPHSKENIVVFSSRFDSEKQPELFMDIVQETAKLDSSILFVVCSGNEITSDDRRTMNRLRQMHEREELVLAQMLTKPKYYQWLQRAKFQLSTSLQDWVSYTLLEALTFDCIPIYPNYRSFPETFGPFSDVLYPFSPSLDKQWVAANVAQDIVYCVSNPDKVEERRSQLKRFVLDHHNETWERMALEMNLLEA